MSKGETYRFEEVVTVYDLPLPCSGVQYGNFLTEMYLLLLLNNVEFCTFCRQSLYQVYLKKVLNFQVFYHMIHSGPFWTILDHS